jgi:hypothetical protein
MALTEFMSFFSQPAAGTLLQVSCKTVRKLSFLSAVRSASMPIWALIMYIEVVHLGQ